MRHLKNIHGEQDEPQDANGDAREVIATVLFVDVVGFSAASLSRTPVEAFRELKTMFDRITAVVKRYRGTVDRTLGDGLLAYFTPEGGRDAEGNHADRAIGCGVEILRTQVANSPGASPASFVLPVRIGINSGPVYMGDLGDSERRDFTIIGNAVNLGQRLEAACEMNRIMIGEETVRLARRFSASTPGLRPRPIIAKSYQEPLDAYEYDPFTGDPDASQRFIAKYRDFAGISRVEARLPCESVALVMATSHGYATVVNVSPSGVMLRFERYIARNAVVYVSQVSAGVEHVDAPPMFVEVRWGSPEPDGTYVHGCQLKSLSDDQKIDLWDLWTSVIDRREGQPFA